MNKKYERYIDYIVSDIQVPYFKNMVDMYGLSPDEYKLVLSKVYNLPVTIIGNSVYDEYSNKVYLESSSGFWEKREYDADGNVIYLENSRGFWKKGEYDNLGKLIYYEDSHGNIEDYR